jgi:UDP-N-acetylglucosamine--N-acetylmuramyl-(pentapeptide) pyrophosphoryl-undecaprenol N-acetylglucosamine transferase
MMASELRVAFAGGGTGGHLYPALNLAQAMEAKWSVRFRFLGTPKGLEAKKIPDAGYELVLIPVAGFHRRLTLKNLSFPFRLWQSMRMSRRFLKDFEPHVVIGTGGYVMGPVLRTATKLGYPTVLQEQNSYPGVTTRMLAAKADRVFIAYAETGEYLSGAKTILSGNPIRFKQREEDKAVLLQRLGLTPERKVILVFGGSQGAAGINKAVRSLIRETGVPEGYQLLWQTGKREYRELDAFVKKAAIQNTVVRSFIDPMYEAYQVADFAVCRSGAMTLSELMIYQVPAILIPLPGAAADHQFKNACAVAEKGGAVVLREEAALSGELKRHWTAFTGGRKDLPAMKAALQKLAKPDATECILDEIQKLVSARNGWPLK